MKATQILMEEHRVIEGVLDTLAKAAASVQSAQPVSPDFFIDAASFIKGFADGCHHQKEEGVLFKAITESGIPVQGGPVGVLLSEHEKGRGFTRAMLTAAEKWKQGDETARVEVVRNTNGYVALLRQHIFKEDTILFPLADRVIPPDGQTKVEAGFDTIEHEEAGEGVHEKYLALAGILAAQVNKA